MARVSRLSAVALLVVGWAAPAAAEPLGLRQSWEGTIDFFTTGAPLAVDGPDLDTTIVDLLAQPGAVDITATDVPATAQVVAAYVFWGGTVDDQMDCATAPSAMDDQVLVAPPGGAFTVVTADACYCAPGAMSYDLQACRADVTALAVAAGMIGTWQVDDFAAVVNNGATDNASFSLVLVYDEPDLLLPRRVALYDGVEELYLGSRTISLAGLDVDNPAEGDLGWYTLDGDVGGAGPESVTVTGLPAGATVTLSDGVNPADNPMNRTINTTVPPQTGVIGVDVDRFDIGAALDPLDTSIDMVYTAGGDKYWVVYNIVGVRVFKPVISAKSTKTWALHADADASGGPTPGDTIRYTITLENDGTAPALVRVEDPIPAAAQSWALVDAGGGTDVSTAMTLIVDAVPVAPGGLTTVVFDMVLSDASAGTFVINVAVFDAGPDGNSGFIVAPSLLVDGPTVDAGVVTIADAAPPDATPAAADASPADAAPSPDGGAVPPDAGATPPDASGGLDASAPGGDVGGCDCRTARGSRVPSVGGLALLLCFGLGVVNRRSGRRRRRTGTPPRT